MEFNAAGRRLLAIVAHPDDAEFSAGGTIARWISEGGEASYLICTDGAAGGGDPTHTPEWLRATREREQREAAEFLGVSHVAFLRHRDGELVATLELRRQIARQVRMLKPDVAIVPNPVRHWHWGATSLRIFHPDHIAVGEAALAALYPGVGNAWTFMELLDEGLEPHTVPEIWVVSPSEPDYAVDISGSFQKKIAAIRKHRSQVGDRPIEERLAERARQAGEQFGLGCAEVFLRLTIDW
ncbi:MAG: PIG-L family deacetylase [Chloroflexota bacterium]|nr:PIG-L family deacetylase [Chloroflexota bacterium]